MRSQYQICLYALLFIVTTECRKVQVSIPDGTLEGYVMRNYDDKKYFAFKSIPYAKPPVGGLRFKASEKNEPWAGILNATNDMPMCRQPNWDETEELGQEDCLYLNVFTNSVIKKNTCKATNKNFSKPVMIYIHGGAFMQGTGNDFGAEFLLTKDIVLVTINYRLGIYGFINTVNSGVNEIGNQGFKDQVLAMKWVQKNIKYFGGDPSQVTITGESAGGMAVHAHMLSPLSAGLFQGAISMSGTASMAAAASETNTATTLADHLGYNTTNITEMMNELRYASHADLFQAVKDLKWLQLRQDIPCAICMVIENPGASSFISDYPLNLIKSGLYSKVPLMLGSANREGLLIYGIISGQGNLQDLATHIPFFFNNKEEAITKVEEFYEISTNAPIDNSINFYSDIWFKHNIYRTALEHAKIQDNNVYYYEFAVDAGLNFLKQMIPEIADFYGACHSDMLGYVFPRAGIPDKDSLEEKVMRVSVKIWTNFVKTGRPNNNLEPFKVDKYNFVNITSNGLETGVLNEASFDFWDEMYQVHGNGL